MALSLPLLFSLLPNHSKPISILQLPTVPVRSVLRLRSKQGPVRSVGRDETELRLPIEEEQQELEEEEEEEEEEEKEVTPEDLEYVEQIKMVLELLKKNRDMLFGEVKLTIMIEDLRETERKRLLGIEDLDDVSRDDYVAALEDVCAAFCKTHNSKPFMSTFIYRKHCFLKVNEGKIPKNRVALRLLAAELMNWPDLEVAAPKSKPQKSLYAKATDTGIDPREAARRLNLDWDSAVDAEPEDDSDEMEVPAAVGYTALYLVTGLPVLIGVSVVLILFYNSLQ